MGKVTLTPTQEQILTIIADEPYFSKTFYMTGGTALSAFYYHHRESEDIDLFTQQPFDQTFVQSWMTKQQKIHNWKLTYTQVFERQTYEISWKDHVGKIDLSGMISGAFLHLPFNIKILRSIPCRILPSINYFPFLNVQRSKTTLICIFYCKKILRGGM